jgi:hypothetical protein
MSATTIDAAEFVRSRLKAHGARITQDEMKSLVEDLKAVLGRALTATDVASVVEVIREVTAEATEATAA